MHTRWTKALTRATNGLLAHQPGKVFLTLRQEFDATLIRCALAATGGCRIEAARLLGIGRNTLARKIHVLGLDREDAAPCAMPIPQSHPGCTE